MDSLPPLDSPYALAADQVESFWTDGHVLLPGLCSPAEVAAYGQHIREAVYAMIPGRSADHTACDQPVGHFLQAMNLVRLQGLLFVFSSLKDMLTSVVLAQRTQAERSPAIARFVHSTRFARAVAELTGAPAVRLFHNQALFKEVKTRRNCAVSNAPSIQPIFSPCAAVLRLQGHGNRTPWHQDQYYWPLDTDRAVGMWMALTDIPADMGPIRFASGSHRSQYLGDHPISAGACRPPFLLETSFCSSLFYPYLSSLWDCAQRAMHSWATGWANEA